MSATDKEREATRNELKELISKRLELAEEVTESRAAFVQKAEEYIDLSWTMKRLAEKSDFTLADGLVPAEFAPPMAQDLAFGAKNVVGWDSFLEHETERMAQVLEKLETIERKARDKP